MDVSMCYSDTEVTNLQCTSQLALWQLGEVDACGCFFIWHPQRWPPDLQTIEAEMKKKGRCPGQTVLEADVAGKQWHVFLITCVQKISVKWTLNNYSCLKFEICVIYCVVVNHQTGLDCLLLKEIILRYELVIVKDFSNYTDLFPGVLPDLWILLILPNMCLDLHIIHFCCITMITVVFFF